ncbi:MAG: hypothetical protein SNH63_02625 [Rikenellaceae bacterium]
MANEKNLMDGAEQKSMGGYRVAAIVLAVLVVAISAIFIVNRQKMVADYEVLSSERNAIQVELTSLSADYDKMAADNKELSLKLEVEKNRADSIASQLEKERSFNSSKLAKYERELGSMRAMMRDYVAQIDSLNALAAQLTAENVEYQKEVAAQTARADKAEQEVADLSKRISEGAILHADNIELLAFKKNGKVTKGKIKKCPKVGVSFSLMPNVLSKAGNKSIYAVITAPGGFVLTTEALPTFDLNGKKQSYSSSRDVDYRNEKLDVVIYYEANGFEGGDYKIDLYCEGENIGTAEVYRK